MDHLSPKLILGCEEPELYQHPPQQKHLSFVLKDLSKKNSQVMVTTHSPLFVSGEVFEDVRLVKKDNVQKESFISSTTYEEIAKTYAEAKKEPIKKSDAILTKIHQILQPSLNEMFFSPRLILVEGLEDIAYITTYLHLLEMWSSYRRLGFNIVQVGGKSNLIKPLIIAKHMGIETYTVFDSDTNETNPKYKSFHEKDNKALLHILNLPEQDHFPTSTIWGNNFVMWNTNIGDIVRNDIGENDWLQFKQKAEGECGYAGDLEKNSLYIASILTLAWNSNKRSQNLENLCKALITDRN